MKNTTNYFTTLLVVFLISEFAYADPFTIPRTYTEGEVLSATDLNNDNNAIKAAVDDNDTRITSNSNAIATAGDGNSLDASDGTPADVISTDTEGLISVTTGIGINATPINGGIAATGDFQTTSYVQAEEGMQIGLISGSHGGLLELRNTIPWSTILRAVNGSSTQVLSLSNAGNMVLSGAMTAGSYATSSDIRFKRDVQSIKDPISIVSQLRGVNFTWNTDKHEQFNALKGTKVGFIAQEVKEVIPDIVHENEDGFLSVEYSSIVPLLVEAVKEQQHTIDTLRKELASVKQMHAQIQSLQKEVNNLHIKQGKSNWIKAKNY